MKFKELDTLIRRNKKEMNYLDFKNWFESIDENLYKQFGDANEWLGNNFPQIQCDSYYSNTTSYRDLFLQVHGIASMWPDPCMNKNMLSEEEFTPTSEDNWNFKDILRWGLCFEIERASVKKDVIQSGGGDTDYIDLYIEEVKKLNKELAI